MERGQTVDSVDSFHLVVALFPCCRLQIDLNEVKLAYKVWWVLIVISESTDIASSRKFSH